MVMHLYTDDTPRARVSVRGENYQGRHRAPRFHDICRPGTLVWEQDESTPSSVMRQVNCSTVLVRHVGTCDDHLAPIDDLVPFADGAARVEMPPGSD
jgi:hypothetical protein